MRILFDHGTLRSIARWLRDHTVVEAQARGWDRLTNGELLKVAEEAGFDVLLTTDKNIVYQQNLTGRRIAVIALGNPQRPPVSAIRRALETHPLEGPEENVTGHPPPHRMGCTRQRQTPRTGHPGGASPPEAGSTRLNDPSISTSDPLSNLKLATQGTFQRAYKSMNVRRKAAIVGAVL